ncbi:uncharacterized protein B0I36DRAFT_44206 [Microdochium trichocladiopsis]|uniref:Uncharacterized protein n=1 Tax=Microdochium trichocladiopsis TaxID=1682393 RepID=A0A9P8XTI7_9PEZI|nr:uncharacterized protein B0I36DRAFT_44206 [Microdochium trichocladiopsis]KAH7016263.1 hypothetical protein B0I36DRAFT_44206 [Microdochium trichocladiopsis]
MRPLLELMHSNFDSFKPARNQNRSHLVRSVHSLIVAADKYDCVRLLKPFAAQWGEFLTVQSNDERELYRLTWISYQLGCADSYIKAATRLVADVPASASSSDWYRPLPPNLSENVSRIRRSMIALLIAPVQGRVDSLVQGGTVCKFRTSEPDDCEARMLGHLIRGLKKHDLWPSGHCQCTVLPQRTRQSSRGMERRGPIWVASPCPVPCHPPSHGRHGSLQSQLCLHSEQGGARLH